VLDVGGGRLRADAEPVGNRLPVVSDASAATVPVTRGHVTDVVPSPTGAVSKPGSTIGAEGVAGAWLSSITESGGDSPLVLL